MNICKIMPLLTILFSEIIAQPDTLWVRRFDNNGKNDICLGAAVDLFNNIIILGLSVDTAYLGEHLIVKYNSNGDTIWTRLYPCSPQQNTSGDVIVDHNNNIIITGVLDGDYVTVKLNYNGDILWSRMYDSGDDDYAYDVAVDHLNNIIITGRSYRNGYWDYLTVKYTPSGDTIWSRRYNSGNSDWAQGIATDGFDNIVVVGVGESIEYGIVKYSADGDFLWGEQYFGDDAHDVAINAENNIIAVGVYGSDYLAIKYNPQGDTLWRKVYPANSWAGAQSVAIDAGGNIIMTGESNDDVYTIKCDSTGNVIWTLSYDLSYESADAVCVDSSNSIIVAGTIWNGNDYDYLVIKYEPETYIKEHSKIKIHNINANLKVYPNPIGNNCDIECNLSDKTAIDLSIFDATGKLVYNVLKGILQSGSYHWVCDMTNLPAGVYFIIADLENKQLTQKVILSK